MTQMNTDKGDPRTFSVIGAAMEVHSCLGHGFLEAVYQEAPSIELAQRNIPYRREVPLDVLYKGNRLPTSYRADFICHDSIIVEIKALSSMGNPEQAQLLNYLKATGHQHGLLLNFGSPKLQYKRLIHGYDVPSSPGVHLCSSVSSVDDEP